MADTPAVKIGADEASAAEKQTQDLVELPGSRVVLDDRVVAVGRRGTSGGYIIGREDDRPVKDESTGKRPKEDDKGEKRETEKYLKSSPSVADALALHKAGIIG